MLASALPSLILGGWFLAGPPAVQSPSQQVMPLPRQLQPQQPALVQPHVVYHSYPRVSRYEVWQNLAVDRYGRFRPAVVFTPYGSYYRYNGQPYPWVSTHTWEFAPYVMGPSQPGLRR